VAQQYNTLIFRAFVSQMLQPCKFVLPVQMCLQILWQLTLTSFMLDQVSCLLMQLAQTSCYVLWVIWQKYNSVLDPYYMCWWMIWWCTDTDLVTVELQYRVVPEEVYCCVDTGGW